MIKKLFICLLSCVLLCTAFVSCQSKLEENPYSAEVLYRADGYTPTASYLLNLSEYDTSGYPTFMGMPLYAKYESEHLMIHADLTMDYYSGKEPEESIREGYEYRNDAPNGSPSDTNPQPITYDEVLQSLQDTRIAEICEMFDEDEEMLSIKYAHESNEIFSVVFAQDYNGTPTYIAELGKDGTCLRVIKIHHASILYIMAFGVDAKQEAA